MPYRVKFLLSVLLGDPSQNVYYEEHGDIHTKCTINPQNRTFQASNRLSIPASNFFLTKDIPKRFPDRYKVIEIDWAKASITHLRLSDLCLASSAVLNFSRLAWAHSAWEKAEVVFLSPMVDLPTDCEGSQQWVVSQAVFDQSLQLLSGIIFSVKAVSVTQLTIPLHLYSLITLTGIFNKHFCSSPNLSLFNGKPASDFSHL